jgi:osmotically-inducible protein OsmY
MTMRVISLLLLMLISASLQGCFPVVAAGVGAGVMMTLDRRTTDAFIDDQRIETKAAELIDQQFSVEMHVNVTSFNYHVLVSGEVPDESTKSEIEKAVSGIGKVSDVNNELAVSPISSLASRSNDSLITSNVKLRYLNNKNFNPDHIKVVTEKGTVYLMGLVNHAEGDAAAEITSTTQGVQQVVKMFEYLD